MSEDKKLKAENKYTAEELYLDAVRINEGLGVHSDRLVDELLFACSRIAELEKGVERLCATGRNLLIRDKQYIGTWWHNEFEVAIKSAEGKEADDAEHNET